MVEISKSKDYEVSLTQELSTPLGSTRWKTHFTPPESVEDRDRTVFYTQKLDEYSDRSSITTYVWEEKDGKSKRFNGSKDDIREYLNDEVVIGDLKGLEDIDPEDALEDSENFPNPKSL